MRQPVESLGLYVVMISTGDLETSVGCWALLGIDLRGDNSGEKVRGCGNAETEQLYPFSFWCCANETSHGSFCGHHRVVRAASCAELLLEARVFGLIWQGSV